MHLWILTFCSITGCTEGEIRLIGGRNKREGRVEICLNDEWGTVCDLMWNVTDAGVACRQLGLGSTGRYLKLLSKSCRELCH